MTCGSRGKPEDRGKSENPEKSGKFEDGIESQGKPEEMWIVEVRESLRRGERQGNPEQWGKFEVRRKSGKARGNMEVWDSLRTGESRGNSEQRGSLRTGERQGKPERTCGSHGKP